MKRVFAWKAAAAAVLAAVIIPGCGYQFSGSGSLPDGVTGLCVAVPENRSSDIGLAPMVASAVVTEAVAAGADAAVGCTGRSGSLMGEIRTVSTSTITRNSDGDGTEERVTITASFRLADEDGAVLWQRASVTGTETYSVTPGADSTAARNAALGEAAEDLAENVWVGLTQRF
ncbi:LPS assembly lipoprotein LptE [Desulfoluna spongiiphila]|uniref:Outer membrane lipoprotein LptE/RlpB (LPS assembly) n=1 Tax=Desulfoluna spongiiphila TaxID=419481 RepID=A0A1G5DE96_9BACT|nr:LPS assembly lipoprotein LptE [Desulfoluna spongiiphila]SCY12934.1 Outer membrane lipoprotein LptE/RlpB (LPS assembly) [Desulfoluna spongiiphila]